MASLPISSRYVGLFELPQSVSRSLLPANLPLFSRHLRLPIPIGVDLPLAPGEHVLWRDVANRRPYADLVA